MSTFADLYQTQIGPEDIKRFVHSVSAGDVRRVLSKRVLNWNDFLTLLSPAAALDLEMLAQKSRQVTLQRFGRTVQMYAPLYVSNECYNSCTYCSFTKENDIPRKTLTTSEFLEELKHLVSQGFQNVLLVSGEDQRIIPLEYFEQILPIAQEYCSYVALEIYPVDLAGYQRLKRSGVDGIVVYQETYDPVRYRALHVAGPKRLFERRLAVPDWIGQAGIRNVGIGVLLGLSEWLFDVAMLAAHAEYLVSKYRQMKVSISLPRIRKGPLGFMPEYCVNDRTFVQIMAALRLFLPDCGFVLSTREESSFRDAVFPIAVTQMSAGSETNPGGYLLAKDSLKQFDITDDRSPTDVAAMVCAQGYEPVWKDWSFEFHG